MAKSVSVPSLKALSQSQLNHFRQRGFVVVGKLLETSELQELREAWATAVQDNRAEKTYGTSKATASTGEPSMRSEKTITA